MNVLGIKSVPLERSTNVSWKTVPGFYFADRKRSSGSIERHVADRRYQAVINLGRVDCDFAGAVSPIFNSPATIRSISTPRAIRGTLNDFLPAYTQGQPHWHKRPGFGGIGKRLCRDDCVVGADGDIQDHIEGTEYRVVTVGNRVVQASRKGERRTRANGRNEFDYAWVGVEGIRQTGIIPILKEAIDIVPGGALSVFGWDIILSEDGPFIIECNTSPGVNDATAARIVKTVREIV